jgi:hypothetical protein
MPDPAKPPLGVTIAWCTSAANAAASRLRSLDEVVRRRSNLFVVIHNRFAEGSEAAFEVVAEKRQTGEVLPVRLFVFSTRGIKGIVPLIQ